MRLTLFMILANKIALILTIGVKQLLLAIITVEKRCRLRLCFSICYCIYCLGHLIRCARATTQASINLRLSIVDVVLPSRRCSSWHRSRLLLTFLFLLHIWYGWFLGSRCSGSYCFSFFIRWLATRSSLLLVVELLLLLPCLLLIVVKHHNWTYASFVLLCLSNYLTLKIRCTIMIVQIFRKLYLFSIRTICCQM